MNQMNMVGFNAGNGALGNMPMPNHGPNGVVGRMPDDHEETNYEAKLNAYIYGYFCFKGKWDLARALKDSGVEFEPPLVNDNTNGANDSMQTDSKDDIDLKKPEDLPHVHNLGDGQGNSFLSSWFALFWDIFSAQRKSTRASANANHYVNQTQVHAPHLLSLSSAPINPLIAGSSHALRPANPNATAYAWDGSWPARKLSEHAAVSNCCYNWESSTEGFREQPFSTVSLPAQ